MTPFAEKPSFSMTITATTRPDRPTGQLPGDAGLPAVSSSNVVPLPVLSLLAGLPPSVRAAVSPSTKYTIGQWGFEPEPAGGVALVGSVDSAELAAACSTVAAALRPGPPAVAQREMIRLRAVTIKSKDATLAETATAIAAYAETLAEYPEDIIVAVCRGWPRRPGGKYWPALAELLEAADALRTERRRLHEALVCGPKPVEPDREAEKRQQWIADRDRRWAEALSLAPGESGLAIAPVVPEVARPSRAERRRLPDLAAELASFRERMAAAATEHQGCGHEARPRRRDDRGAAGPRPRARQRLCGAARGTLACAAAAGLPRRGARLAGRAAADTGASGAGCRAAPGGGERRAWPVPQDACACRCDLIGFWLATAEVAAIRDPERRERLLRYQQQCVDALAGGVAGRGGERAMTRMAEHDAAGDRQPLARRTARIRRMTWRRRVIGWRSASGGCHAAPAMSAPRCAAATIATSSPVPRDLLSR